jgi:hypothetical protein
MMNHQPPFLNTIFDLGCGQAPNQFSSDYCDDARYHTLPTTNIDPPCYSKFFTYLLDIHKLDDFLSGNNYPVPLPSNPSPFAYNAHGSGSFVGKQMPAVYSSNSSQQGSSSYISQSDRLGQPLVFPHIQLHSNALESPSHQSPFQFVPSRYGNQGIVPPARSPMSSSSLSQESSFPQLPVPMNTMDLLQKDTSGIDWVHAEFLGALQQVCDRVDHGGMMANSPQWPNHSDIQGLPFDSQSWSDMISLAVDPSNSATSSSHRTVPLNQYPLFPQYETSPFSSPSPSPSPSRDFSRRVSPLSSAASTPPASRRGSVDLSAGVKKCSHCHATSTPLWRREPTTLKPLCNACGLYLQQRNKLRPQELIDADADDDESDISGENLTGPECSHCHTRQTSVWRRSKTGAQLCNACGVYSRLRGKDRPLSLKRNRIKPRSKHTSK